MRHTCHAFQCKIPVPPRMFMCKKHWYSLPKSMRDGVWARYREGQEIDKRPSEEYVKYTDKCIRYLMKAKVDNSKNKNIKTKEKQKRLF